VFLTEHIFSFRFSAAIVDAVFHRDYAVVQGYRAVTGDIYIALNRLPTSPISWSIRAGAWQHDRCDTGAILLPAPMS